MTTLVLILLLIALALDVYALWEFHRKPRVELPPLEQEIAYYRGHVLLVRHRGATPNQIAAAMIRHVVLIEKEAAQLAEAKR